MKITFLTNCPSPYRVEFFNELGKTVDLTVLFETKAATDRDEKWKSGETVQRLIHLTPVSVNASNIDRFYNPNSTF